MMRKEWWKLAALLAMLMSPPETATACTDAALFAPTDRAKTVIRQGLGEFGAPRASGGTHSGVDLVAPALHSDSSAYAVLAVAGGTVAYARFNGTAPNKGFGNVVVIDHGNDCYSLYAHLASDPFTPIQPGGNLAVKRGQKVKPGEAIGFFVNVAADLASSGNAIATNAGARHQLHFGLLQAPSGRSGDGSFIDTILRKDGRYVDPTPLLSRLGYEKRNIDAVK
jgi:murein DD-endopeptidase MepM/ murein hydrolase activator NlpD